MTQNATNILRAHDYQPGHPRERYPHIGSQQSIVFWRPSKYTRSRDNEKAAFEKLNQHPDKLLEKLDIKFIAQ